MTEEKNYIPNEWKAQIKLGKELIELKEVLRESSQVLRGLIYDLHQNKSISNHMYMHYSDRIVSNLEKLKGM